MENQVIEQAVKEFKKLSGVGSKTAQRYVYELLDLPEEQFVSFYQHLKQLESIKKCQICYNYTMNDVCEICQSEREKKLIVCSFASDIASFENVFPDQFYYHVLGGVIDPLNDVGIEELHFTSLFERINDFQEIILGLPSSINGELTANYIANMLESQEITVSKLAQGIPLGYDVGKLDEYTLKNSLEMRKEYKE